jgi:hypothetical protein
LWLERPGMRICELLLGPPPSQARWADHLGEAAGRLEAELTARWLVDTVGGHKMHISTGNIPTFHSRYRI